MGVEFALVALARSEAARPGALRWLIRGSGTLEHQVTFTVRDLGLDGLVERVSSGGGDGSECVYLHPYVGRSDVDHLLAHLDAGGPAVAVATAATLAVGARSGLVLVPPYDVDALARELVRL